MEGKGEYNLEVHQISKLIQVSNKPLAPIQFSQSNRILNSLIFNWIMDQF